jgi:hypothetical protein
MSERDALLWRSFNYFHLHDIISAWDNNLLRTYKGMWRTGKELRILLLSG